MAFAKHWTFLAAAGAANIGSPCFAQTELSVPWKDWVQVTPFKDPYVQNRSGQSQAPQPANDVLRWANSNDYPSKALREDRNGTVAILLIVNTNGRSKTCRVTKSSGHEDIDKATCKNVVRRARFVSAKNYQGRLVEGMYPLSVRYFASSWAAIERVREESTLWEPPIVIPGYD